MPFSIQRFESDSALRQDIKCIWTFEQGYLEHNRMVVFPDTHIEVLFNCGAPNVVTNAGGAQVELPPVFMNGLQTQPMRPSVTGDPQFIAVRMNAWSMRHFLDLPTCLNMNDIRMTPLGASWQQFGKTVRDTVRRYGYAEAADRIQQFLLDSRHPQPADRTIRLVGERLHDARGQVTIHELIGQSHFSPRQFERQFKYWTGMLPKAYARLARHEAVRESLMSDPYRSLVTLAQDFGYTDQAHFSHDFKLFTTYSPGQFAAYLRGRAPQFG